MRAVRYENVTKFKTGLGKILKETQICRTRTPTNTMTRSFN